MEDLPASDDREAPETVTMERATQIMDLPDDLILCVLKVLCRHCDGQRGGSFQAERDSQKALVSFSKTCFSFHKLARPYLFHHVCFNYDYLEIRDRPWQGLKHERALFRLLRSLAGDHVPDPDALEAAGKRSLANGIDDLATSMKHLEVNLTPNLHMNSGRVGRVGKIWKSPGEDTFGFDWLPEILNRATKLEHLELHMELPLIQHAGFTRDMDRYGRSKYDSIKTLSLIYPADYHGVAERFHLRSMYMIFNRCSNLTTLEIHGIAGVGEQFIDETSGGDISHVTSKLKVLRLTNCTVVADDIEILIKGIKDLESFTLSRGELRRFQWIAERVLYFPDMLRSQVLPATMIAALIKLFSHSLRHLDLGPFEMKLWQTIWHADPPEFEAKTVENIRKATIPTLRSFKRLEHVQLAQDSILGVPNILPDPDGTRLVSMLPRTLKCLRLTHVNNNLADSLLKFAFAVADGEFPALKEVSLHGQDHLMERCRHGRRFRIELLLALERHWEFLNNNVLEKMKDILKGAGVKLSWEAMGSNHPAEGWPGNPMLQSLGMEPTPPWTEDEVAFYNFSRQRSDEIPWIQRKYALLGITDNLEKYDRRVMTLPVNNGREQLDELEGYTRPELNEDLDELD
ncbi:hypothetical protein CKAH01_13341 [Colletotrichum kahawae]|uniref:Uncharacterized protein n=1 Tax=Colletotrichum kahawae TaxID=34407 RepID=A0AAD9YR54_COLKA|nr:hypothetical protein CKAH01_13341 [Colletotrichum kahawae]